MLKIYFNADLKLSPSHLLNLKWSGSYLYVMNKLPLTGF